MSRLSLIKTFEATCPVFFEKTEETDGSTYTSYMITVLNKENGAEWNVYKRYRDFAKLYSQLSDRYAHLLRNYKFPNKSVFNTFSTFTKLRRRDGFDEFLQLLLQISPVPDVISDFLELEEHSDSVYTAHVGTDLITPKQLPSSEPSSEEITDTKLKDEFSSLLSSSIMLVLVIYVLSLYCGAVNNSNLIKKGLCFFVFTILFTAVRLFFRRRELEIELMLQRRYLATCIER